MHAHASASVHTQAHTHTLLLDMHEPTRADTRKHMHICLHTFKNALRLCTEFALSPLLFLYATLLWLPCYGMKEPRACPWHTLLRSLSHSNRKAGTFIPILMQKLNRHWSLWDGHTCRPRSWQVWRGLARPQVCHSCCVRLKLRWEVCKVGAYLNTKKLCVVHC